MPFSIYDSNKENKPKEGVTSIAPGVVKSNCDLIMQGKMQVRIPSRGIDVWARVMGAGGGSGRGMMIFPKPDDEVLVAFNAEDPRDAFILGGLWGNTKRLPAKLPTDPQTKHIFRSGMTPAVGHQLEFDDVLQTITVRASLGQTIELSPTGVKVEANANTSIEMLAPPEAGPGVVTITVGTNKITITPAGIEISSAGSLTLKASRIDLNAANVSIKGINLMLNT